MRRRAKVVVVGAGIMGLSTAWHLARRGLTDVLVVDRGYLCGGASGRNGGGVRAQFSTETNIRLMQESIAICREFAAEMKINVWFRQGGYLFLARSEARAKALEASVALQNRCGLPTRLLEPWEAKRIVPELSIEGVTRASFNAEDGVVFPWPFVWGYAKAAQDLGVEVATFTEVTAIEQRNGRVVGVKLRPMRLAEVTRNEPVLPAGDEFYVECDELVVCAGAWSPSVARLAGVELPNPPHRHEICSTEPLKPWLGPLVADLTDGLYFSQSMRGEIVGGVSVDPVPDGIDQRSSQGVPRDVLALPGAGHSEAGEGEGAPSVGGLLRPHARSEPHRGEGARAREPHPRLRLHGPRLHDGAGDGQAHRRARPHRRDERALRTLVAGAVPHGQAPPRVDDHRVVAYRARRCTRGASRCRVVRTAAVEHNLTKRPSADDPRADRSRRRHGASPRTR